MKPHLTSPTAPDPDTAGRPGRAPGGELRALTGLRIVAALWVVAFHFHFTALPGVTDVSALLGPLVTQGSLGVDLFFVLSGFVIAHTYLDRMGPRLRLRAAGRFVWARAGRMWPAYIVVFHVFGIWLLVRATYGTGGDIAFQSVQPELSWAQWLRQVLLVQMWDRPFLDGASWVGPTWSISAEWLAYLLFPVTALVFFRLRRLPAVVLGIGAVVAMAPMAAAFLVVGSPYYPFSWLVRVLCGFSAGVLTLLAVRRLTGSARARRSAPATATVALVGIVGGLLVGNAAGGGLLGLVVVLFPVLVGALALTERGPARWLGARPMVHGGRISYALYLVHIPMFEMFWLALRNGTGERFGGLLAPGTVSAHVVALVVLVATVPVAHLLYTFVEQPARGWMRAFPGARPVAAVPAPAAPVDATLPARVAGDRPVDTDGARLDPPTLRVSRAGASPSPSLPSPLPRQAGPADPVPALVRVHDARDMARVAGHGDDRHGDRLAGNLMAAARLRSSGTVPDGQVTDRADLVRRAGGGPTFPPLVPPQAGDDPSDGWSDDEWSADGWGADGWGAEGRGAEGRGAEGRGADGWGAEGRGADGGAGGTWAAEDLSVPGRDAASRGDARRGGADRAGAGLGVPGRGGADGADEVWRDAVPRGADLRSADELRAAESRDVADRTVDRVADGAAVDRTVSEPGHVDGAGVPEPRAGRPIASGGVGTSGGSRSGVERCGRSRHRAHGSAATPIVAAAAAAVRGRRRPAHGLPPRHA